MNSSLLVLPDVVEARQEGDSVWFRRRRIGPPARGASDFPIAAFIPVGSGWRTAGQLHSLDGDVLTIDRGNKLYVAESRRGTYYVLAHGPDHARRVVGSTHGDRVDSVEGPVAPPDDVVVKNSGGRTIRDAVTVDDTPRVVGWVASAP